MRTWLAALTLAVASPALADPGAALEEACGQLIGSQVTECYAAAGNRHIDRGAAHACAQLIGTQVTQCVATIGGKDYNPGEVKSCGDLIGSNVTSCLASTGRPHYQPAPVAQAPVYAPPPPRGGLSVPEIRAEIAAAIEQLHAADPRGAERRLRHLLDGLR